MPRINTVDHQWYNLMVKLLRMIASKLGASASATILLAEFVVGDPGAPGDGETQYANPSLDGQDILVFKNGVGYLEEGINYELLPGGGIELIGGGVFSTDERYLIFGV